MWSNKTLEYFKNEKSEKVLKKPIDLNKCKSIDGNLKNKKWDNIFCLNTEYRKFFLVADSSDGMERWISKLCEICGFTEQGKHIAVQNSKNWKINLGDSWDVSPQSPPWCRYWVLQRVGGPKNTQIKEELNWEIRKKCLLSKYLL